MRRLLRPIADVRADELRPVVLMAAYYFTLLVTYYLLKPARDSLFLVELGPRQLPLVFILIALVAQPIGTLYGKTAARLSLGQLTVRSTLLLAGMVVLLRVLIGVWRESWVFYVLYVFVSLYGALTVSQFWLLANHVYEPAQAKRLFAVLNTGAVLGAFFGGEIAGFLVGFIGWSTEDLLLVAAGVLVGSLGFVRETFRANPSVRDERGSDEGEADGEAPSFRDLLATVRGERLLVLIVAIIAVEMMASTVIDYQFKEFAFRSYPDDDRLTRFLGTFYGRVSLLALVFQVALLPWMLRRFGIASALLLMPTSLLLGSAALFALPGLTTATLLRGADQSFEHSADKVGRELLFMPIALDVTRRVKVFIDVFVDRAFRGLAGVLLLVLTVWLAVDARWLSVLVMGLLVVWIGAALGARRQYRDAFADAIREGHVERRSAWTRAMSGGQALEVLRRAVRDADDARVGHALRALEGVDHPAVAEAVRPLLAYPSKEIRQAAIRVLAAQSDGVPYDEIADHLVDASGDGAAASGVGALRNRADWDADVDLLYEYLEEEAPELLTTESADVVCYGPDERRACLSAAALEALVDHDDEALRRGLAKALADAEGDAPIGYLVRLARDPAPDVRRAAVRSMGAHRGPACAAALIRLLADDDVHVQAWQALARFGPDVLPALADALESPETEPDVRRSLPRVLGAIPHPRSAELLAAHLDDPDPALRYNVTAALLRLGAADPDLSLDADAIDRALRNEAETYYRLAQVAECLNETAAAPADGVAMPSPLVSVLDKRLDRSAQRIFGLLGLRYARREVADAYEAFSGTEGRLRSVVAEWLDNVLDYDVRQLLGPIIGQAPRADLAEAGEAQLGLTCPTREEAFLTLLGDADPKLRTVALDHLPGALTGRLHARLEAARSDPDPDVQAAAEEAAARVTNDE